MILMYHKVHPNSPTLWWVTVNDFYRQMVELSNKEVVYLDDYDLNDKNQVVITFDGIYKNILEYALPILKHFNYPFELFLTSDYIGLDNKFDHIEPIANFVDVIDLKELINGGGRLQWHTRSHLNLEKISDKAVIINELLIPEELKKIDNTGFNWFAYPHGIFNDVVIEEVKKKFKGAVSCNQGNLIDKFKLNRLTVINDTTFRENKIACIIASYNYGDFLIEAIESVLRQTVLPNEILISDDCSNDETQVIAEEYVSRYPRLIKYNRNENNLGIVDHFNKAIKLVNGEYIFFLGADNRIQSDYIERTSEILDSDESIGIAYTDYSFFGSKAKLAYFKIDVNERGGIIDDIYYKVNFPEFDDFEMLKNRLIKGNFIQGSSMFKLKGFNEVGGYLKTNDPEDFNLFKRFIEANWGAKKAKTNLEYRQHSFTQANNIFALQNKLLFYKSKYEKTIAEKQRLDNSKVFQYSFKVFMLFSFIKTNYKFPKIIIKKILFYAKKTFSF
tara:strand:- start:24571 stop:26076 length:1506 start_codon:yes stop_codon:yes gene_type:complete